MKNSLALIIALLMFSPLAANAFSADAKGCSGDCMACHRFDKKEAEAIVQKLKESRNIPPAATIGEIKPSPVGGVWQVELEADGQRGAIFVDFSKKFLIGQIIPLEAIGPRPERKVDFSKVPLKDTVVLGSASAKKKIVVFTDPDCPYCRTLHEEMKKVVAMRKDVAFHLVLFPLPMHKEAYKKSQAVLCERSQRLLDDAFSGKALPEPKCSAAQVEKNIALGKSLEIGSTPTLVRGDGLVLPGAMPAEKLIEWIDGK